MILKRLLLEGAARLLLLTLILTYWLFWSAAAPLALIHCDLREHWEVLLRYYGRESLPPAGRALVAARFMFA